MAKKLKQDINIGTNLNKYRKPTELSQEKVAAKLQLQGLDVTREMISQIEQGRYNVRKVCCSH